jgi:DNA-binding transcriptional ArsR family regulator
MEPSYRPLASLFKVLADENRLKIIAVIGQEEKTVSQIVKEAGLSQPLVSHHLRLLRQGRILRTRREGPFVYYSLANPSILETLEAWTQFISEEMKREVEEWKMPCWCPPMMRRM